MKPISLLRFIALIIAALFFQSCLETELTTTVHEDGTIDHCVITKGDSETVHRNVSPLNVTSEWKMTVEKIEEGKWMRRAERRFANSGEAYGALAGISDSTLHTHETYVKDNRGFFTRFRYSVMYRSFDPFRAVPITDFLSAKELDAFLPYILKKDPTKSKGDSLWLEDASKRFEIWQARNMFEAYIAAFEKGAERIADTNMTIPKVRAAKDSLFARMKDGKTQEISLLLEKRFGTVLTQRAIEANASEFSQFERKRRFLERMLNNPYKVNIVMPGIITASNAKTITGNKATWDSFLSYCYFSDLEIWVESDVTNWWAIIVTAAVVALLLVLLFIALLRRRRLSVR